MNKKVIIGIVVVIAIFIIGITGYFVLGDNLKKESNTSNDNSIANGSIDNNDSTIGTSGGSVLVVYYSATGSTRKVAEEISKNLNASLFEIEPEDVYTSGDLNWSDSDSRVSREHNDESLRDVKLKTTKVDNWENYDTVLIGYPIWWGVAAWPVNNFVKENDFTGKTVIPFCTSASSSLGNSGKLLEEMTKTGNWQDGYRFSSSASDNDIKSFTDSLK